MSSSSLSTKALKVLILHLGKQETDLQDRIDRLLEGSCCREKQFRREVCATCRLKGLRREVLIDLWADQGTLALALSGLLDGSSTVLPLPLNTP